ncbi:MAG: DNA primase [Candidatus Paceibacterota bacterium]
MNSTLLAIKERLGIEEVVSSYIKTERAGANFKARCPFHNEKTPSFFISPDRGSYYCFGCGAKGDIFTFVSEFEGLDFKGALKLLAEKANVPLSLYREKDDVSKSEKDRLFEVMEKACGFFEHNLEIQKDAKEYLLTRGLDSALLKNFRLGYARDDWRLLYQYLRDAKFTDTEIEKAGLLKRKEEKDGAARDVTYDRFRGRIMFPIMDSSGRVIAFSGRLFPDDGKSAKYLNSPETVIFKKSTVLYGLDKAKLSIKKNNFAILVEGQMDLLLSHQAGFTNTVATSGTAFSDELEREEAVSNLGLLRRMSKNLVIAYDGDEAGVKAALRASKIAISLGMDVKIAPLKSGLDPADVVSKEGKDAWREVVRNSMTIVEFLLEKILQKAPVGDRKLGLLVKDQILPFVAMLSTNIDQEFFLKKISGKTAIPESTLRADLSTVSQASVNEKAYIEKIEQHRLEMARKDYILRRLLGFLWLHKDENSETLLDEVAQTLGLTRESLNDQYALYKEDLLYEAEVFYSNGVDVKRDTIELLNNLKEESLKEQLTKKLHELYKAEEVGDESKIQEILKECQIINNKIHEIKNSRSM